MAERPNTERPSAERPLEERLRDPGGQGAGDVRDWTHRHGAGGGDPDPELSLSGVLWTAGGIAAVTALAMVLMIWMLGGLTGRQDARQAPPTPAEEQRLEAVRRAGEERRAAEAVPRPALALPPEYEVPPAPRLELDPSFDLRRLRAEEERLLGAWAWADEEAGTVRIPIATALDLAAAGELPGVPRGAGSPGPAAGTATAEEGPDAPR
jgi:hypothetical protein